MSYILEALRKAERERQRGEAPSVPEILYAQPGARRNWLPWVAAMLLLLALNGGFLWYFWLHDGENRKPPAPSAAAEPVVDPAREGAAALERRAKPGVDEEKPAAPAGAPMAQSQDAATSSTSTSNAAKAPAAPQAKHAPLARQIPAEAKKHEKPGSSSGTEQAVTKPLKIAPIDKALFEEMPPPAPADAPLPLANRMDAPPKDNAEPKAGLPSLEEMPADIQKNVPTLKINVLAYSSAPEERFAVINMVKYSRGDQLPGGAILRDIQANGLVLELNGRRFRLAHR